VSMTNEQIAVLLGVLLVAAVILRLTLWRAILCVAPSSVQLEIEEPGAPSKVDPALRKTDAELLRLGFERLGTHSEKSPLGPSTLCFDYLHRTDRTFATVFDKGGVPHLYFLSRLTDGATALTANYRRPARELPGHYFSGYLEDFPPERVYKAHLRRVEGHFAGGDADVSLEGRVALARTWYAGPGRSEVRQQHVQGLLWTVGSLGMVAALLFARR
jgi:hypothetical protein